MLSAGSNVLRYPESNNAFNISAGWLKGHASISTDLSYCAGGTTQLSGSHGNETWKLVHA